MIGTNKTGTLQHCIISGVVHSGLSVTTADGRPATLAVIDADGNVIESGPPVAREAFNISTKVFRNFWIGQGHIREFTEPPGIQPQTAKQAAHR